MARRRDRQPNQRKAYSRHHNRVTLYTKRLNELYIQFIRGGVALVDRFAGLDDDNPITKRALEDLRRTFAIQMMDNIRIGVINEWREASQLQEELVRRVFGGVYPEQYRLNRPEAVAFFLKRKTNGLDLSQRVWRLSGQAQEELTTALKVGLSDGLSAHELSREVKKFLQEPDKLFRRVRDDEGELQLSKPAQAYRPGQGVYRSSHKNALRLTQTEINMAYRRSEQSRWQAMDFVVGYEVKRSGTGYDCPVCDALAGKYPKDFIWSTWHPHCRCYAIPILKTEEELFDDPDKPSANEVKEPHEGFKRWMAEQKPRIVQYQERGTLPLFLKENKQALRLLKDEKLSNSKTPSLLERAKARQAKRTPQQIEDIKKRWEKRARKQNQLDRIIEELKANNIEYKKVTRLQRVLTEDEIIQRVGGGDLTKGSCSSLAFAYAGNKGGFDVLDFRDGKSRSFFSKGYMLVKLAEDVGGVVVEEFNDFVAANTLLKHTKEGREYYFACGSHAAIIRKNRQGYEYLELQSATSNGFKSLSRDILRKRFGAKRSRSFYREKYKVKSCLIDIDLLNNSGDFIEMLGYINTNEKDQKKGVRGTTK